MPGKSAAVTRAEETRARLVAVARRLFARKGFAATATEDIVAAAKVTRGALYFHFADKTALFAAVLPALPPGGGGIRGAAAAGPRLLSAAGAVAAVGWIPLAVHTRTVATEVRASGFVRAAVLAGAEPGRITRRHVLPAVLPAVLRHGLARVPHAALGIAALSFLGLGAAPDTPEWGAMLAESLAYVERAPWTILAPTVGLAVLGLVVGLVRGTE